MTHISLTFKGACEKAIIDALRNTPHSQHDGNIMAQMRIDTQPNGRTLCACGETSSVIAEVIIDGQWHTGYAGYCDQCGSDDYDGSSILVADGGRYRSVAPNIV